MYVLTHVLVCNSIFIFSYSLLSVEMFMYTYAHTHTYTSDKQELLTSQSVECVMFGVSLEYGYFLLSVIKNKK